MMTLRRALQLAVIALLLFTGPAMLVWGAKGFARNGELSVPEEDGHRLCPVSLTEFLGLDVAANKMLCFGASCGGIFLTCYAMLLLFPERRGT
jgi:hypothetical protein